MVRSKWKKIADRSNPIETYVAWTKKSNGDVFEIVIEREGKGKYEIWQRIAPKGDWDSSRGWVDHIVKSEEKARKIAKKLRKLM